MGVYKIMLEHEKKDCFQLQTGVKSHLIVIRHIRLDRGLNE